jgi:hypothetical protein
MAHSSFRKRGEKRVTVFSGAELANAAENNSQSNVSYSSPYGSSYGSSYSHSYDLDRIRKGMTVTEVENILGHGDTDPMRTPGKFAVVNYRDKDSGIAVVYKDRRVVSRAFIQ